jgi:GDP-L-fucose synthase
LADALFFIARHYSSAEPINVGVGDDLTIRELAELIAEVVDYQGRLQFDRGQPDGTPRKLLDCSRLRSLGWAPTVDLRSGLERTWSWFRNL